MLPDSTRVAIEGTAAPTTSWSLLDSYASVVGLGNRIEQFVARDQTGSPVAVRRIAPGQYEGTKAAARFSYEVNLTPPGRASDSSLVSWLTKDRGLLLLGDLLPIASRESGPSLTVVQFITPKAWAVYSNEKADQQGSFVVADISRAVFAVGMNLRTSRISESKMTLSLVADGEWAFADQDALEMAGKVLKEHRNVFGAMPARQAMLIILPFPREVGASQWSAETRGATVTLLIGRSPSKVAALAQLSTPLTHELFHLWAPNALALEGDYDWFYEGFTLYQAARAAIRLGYLTFQEFLNAVARAYDAYKASTDSDRLSLIDASKQRWTTAGASVYSKSFVIAFMYDLKLRSLTQGKRSLDDAYHQLFQSHRSGDALLAKLADGNELAPAVLAELGMDDFVTTFVRNPVSIDPSQQFTQYGLTFDRIVRAHISVSEKLSRRQRDLLRQLGYNDATHATRSR